jgi:predicted PhzF superfamily epimerase YddE/YHI9
MFRMKFRERIRSIVGAVINAGIAQWLIRTDQAPAPYTGAQGHRVGRSGVIEISSGPNGEFWVGGASTSCIRGTVRL